ncbi:replication protein A 32 kDa subunit-like [Cololabis saira]|uniref:replication protein A 32 kDa subunit-like n=1 Tax=Cololabis saira TaxID=129043 RepID=UPI002AD3FAD9|nr:replication protein A 32 kDa subunit-like [Cololabis saira]
MWKQACRESAGGTTRPRADVPKMSHLEILPATVSQLLAATRVTNDTFTIWDWELNQVSIVGIIRGFAPFVTNIQYSVDDMTGPPLNVKLWVNMEDGAMRNPVSPGTYVRVIGSLRDFSGQRSVLAIDVRCIDDLNEITSHMLEVVQAHMQIFGKVFDGNMNTTIAQQTCRNGVHHEGLLPVGLSTIQNQVLNVIQSFSICDEGISFHDLQKKLDYLSMYDIRGSLAFLTSEGHIFSIDEHHFKST